MGFVIYILTIFTQKYVIYVALKRMLFPLFLSLKNRKLLIIQFYKFLTGPHIILCLTAIPRAVA